MISDKYREYCAGATLLLIGGGSVYTGSQYSIGTLTAMGPGFFPVALGVILSSIGILIFASELLNRAVLEAPTRMLPETGGAARFLPDWRGLGCIVASLLCFVVLAKYTGLLAATFVCVFVASFADRTAKLKASLLLASGVTVFGIALFWWLLSVQIPVIRGIWQ